MLIQVLYKKVKHVEFYLMVMMEKSGFLVQLHYRFNLNMIALMGNTWELMWNYMLLMEYKLHQGVLCQS